MNAYYAEIELQRRRRESKKNRRIDQIYREYVVHEGQISRVNLFLSSYTFLFVVHKLVDERKAMHSIFAQPVADAALQSLNFARAALVVLDHKLIEDFEEILTELFNKVLPKSLASFPVISSTHRFTVNNIWLDNVRVDCYFRTIFVIPLNLAVR